MAEIPGALLMIGLFAFIYFHGASITDAVDKAIWSGVKGTAKATWSVVAWIFWGGGRSSSDPAYGVKMRQYRQKVAMIQSLPVDADTKRDLLTKAERDFLREVGPI